MIRLFTSWYPEASLGRRSELLQCLERNLSLECVSQVFLLLENVDAPFVHPKLVTKRIAERPCYHDFFEWVNNVDILPSDLSIICNSDIYFDASISALDEGLIANQCVALARWDIQEDGSKTLRDRNDSQDSWVFRGKIRSIKAKFHVGVPRCDNRVLFELENSGYHVINPAFSIYSYHLHAGDRADYGQEHLPGYVDPPYSYLWPHNLFPLSKWAWHLLRSRAIPLGWRFDWRKLWRTTPFRVGRKIISACTAK